MLAPLPKVGSIYGKWSVQSGPTRRSNYVAYWVCECECGTIKEVQQSSLLQGKSTSCGCTREVSEVTRQRLSKARKGQPAPRPAGSTHSEETKQKMSIARKKLWDAKKQEEQEQAEALARAYAKYKIKL